MVSGIQPTGSLHVGNYFGAIRRCVRLQQQGNDLTLFIADLHSLTAQQVCLSFKHTRCTCMLYQCNLYITTILKSKIAVTNGHVIIMRLLYFVICLLILNSSFHFYYKQTCSVSTLILINTL